MSKRSNTSQCSAKVAIDPFSLRHGKSHFKASLEQQPIIQGIHRKNNIPPPLKVECNCYIIILKNFASIEYFSDFVRTNPVLKLLISSSALIKDH